jgi:hypothetical protein
MAYLRPSTIQYKDHIIHVRWEDGMPYLNVQDVEQALGLPFQV